MATNFWEALTSFVNANFISSLPGGWHANEASVVDTFPLAVYSEVAEPRQGFGGGQGTYDGEFQIAIYGTNKAANIILANSIASTLCIMPTGITYTDGSVLIYIRPSSFMGSIDPEKGPGAVDIFQNIVSFRFVVQRPF